MIRDAENKAPAGERRRGLCFDQFFFAYYGTKSAREQRAHPAIIHCDNGTDLTSTALDPLAYWNHVQFDLTQSVDNSVCEACNDSLRRECLTRH